MRNSDWQIVGIQLFKRANRLNAWSLISKGFVAVVKQDKGLEGSGVRESTPGKWKDLSKTIVAGKPVGAIGEVSGHYHNFGEVRSMDRLKTSNCNSVDWVIIICHSVYWALYIHHITITTNSLKQLLLLIIEKKTEAWRLSSLPKVTQLTARVWTPVSYTHLTLPTIYSV